MCTQIIAKRNPCDAWESKSLMWLLAMLNDEADEDTVRMMIAALQSGAELQLHSGWRVSSGC